MGRDEGTAGNAADLVKHTVWLSVLDELMKVSPWKERIVVHETHAGRGLYAPVSQANREHARWLCVSAPSTVILASAQERVRQHLGLEDCVAYAGSALLGMASIWGYKRTLASCPQCEKIDRDRCAEEGA